jgi:hypothetical protein
MSLQNCEAHHRFFSRVPLRFSLAVTPRNMSHGERIETNSAKGDSLFPTRIIRQERATVPAFLRDALCG